MQVADALSRCDNPDNTPIDSPVEDAPFFPMMTEYIGEINLPKGVEFVDLFKARDKPIITVQAMTIVETQDSDPYDADTDEPISHDKPRVKRKTNNQSDQNIDVTVKQIIEACPGVNLNNIKNLQRNDENLKKFIAYLENDTLPESQKESRRILLESADLI